MNTLSSITNRLLSTHAARALLGFACVAALSTVGAPLAAASTGDFEQVDDSLEGPTGSLLVCGASTLHVRIDPGDGSVWIGIEDSTGTFHFSEASQLELGFDGLQHVNLRFWFVDSEGMLEVSPEGEDTELHSTWRERVTLRLQAETSATPWTKDYLIVPLDPSGQELPAVPKIQVKAKKTCPVAPILPQP